MSWFDLNCVFGELSGNNTSMFIPESCVGSTVLDSYNERINDDHADKVVSSFRSYNKEPSLLDQNKVCQSADGWVELLRHGGGLAVVSKMVFGVSSVASRRAVRILYLVAMFGSSARVLQEKIELGVVEKLMLVLQVDCGRKMKEKSKGYTEDTF
ncbi:hypothetical protein HanRHA438_Chr08g0338461 [Helianthus annuus]|uniref:U-box domain-containing protein n=2 Tax=Helianthus annuus TaxID=4232 RepID=A0A9K3ICH7_HELAN|nr:hypothetical protein HanXRQr2_Chr08g0327291 [Helianthus annuus]KAJ0538052.1 hypothetical protein HanHA300_Chr08g0270601 [Helianthus annuus]KAJ0552640.1 hypothetical protein HanHA89_Chr08g0287451 [Helianthus annuus]KAJ0896784.1 hypothetical protein HanRHA438_Chr08g0338461 [Helianthus annuus]